MHVMDDVTLDIVLGELDTVLDFTDYLGKKAAFIRSGLLRTAVGEQDLLAHYAIRVNEEGEHDFEADSDGTPIDLPPGGYQQFARDSRYLARREANRPSYAWDRLIEKFTSHMIDGTNEVLDGFEYDLQRNEAGVRYMALERRVARRAFGAGFADARERGASVPVFFRRMVTKAETGFFVLTMKNMGARGRAVGYDEYRQMRANVAIICAKGVLLRHPHLARVVGVSCEPAGQAECSEDLVYAEQADWSNTERAAILKDCRRVGILEPRARIHHWRADEFPTTPQ